MAVLVYDYVRRDRGHGHGRTPRWICEPYPRPGRGAMAGHMADARWRSEPRRSGPRRRAAITRAIQDIDRMKLSWRLRRESAEKLTTNDITPHVLSSHSAAHWRTDLGQRSTTVYAQPQRGGWSESRARAETTHDTSVRQHETKDHEPTTLHRVLLAV